MMLFKVKLILLTQFFLLLDVVLVYIWISIFTFAVRFISIKCSKIFKFIQSCVLVQNHLFQYNNKKMVPNDNECTPVTKYLSSLSKIYNSSHVRVKEIYVFHRKWLEFRVPMFQTSGHKLSQMFFSFPIFRSVHDKIFDGFEGLLNGDAKMAIFRLCTRIRKA